MWPEDVDVMLSRAVVCWNEPFLHLVLLLDKEVPLLWQCAFDEDSPSGCIGTSLELKWLLRVDRVASNSALDALFPRYIAVTSASVH